MNGPPAGNENWNRSEMRGQDVGIVGADKV